MISDQKHLIFEHDFDKEETRLVVTSQDNEIDSKWCQQGAPPTIGTRLGKCILTAQIGKGSSCLVFEGFHETLKIPVAIKVFIPPDYSHSEAIRERFSVEAETLAQLNHPYIVRVLDFEDGLYPYIILEYVDGISLADLISLCGRINYKKAAYYIYRAAAGLSVAHKNGIIHRDIKPANILLTQNGEAKLTDLGMAHFTSNLNSAFDVQSKQFEGFHGTPAYVAPEQAFEPHSGDGRSDIYSLGATFYHAITGRYPFRSKSVYTMIMKHAKEPLVPPHKIVNQIPTEISEFIQKMMAKLPEDRFDSVDDLLSDLISFFLEGGPDDSNFRSENSKDELNDPLGESMTRIIIRAVKKIIQPLGHSDIINPNDFK